MKPINESIVWTNDSGVQDVTNMQIHVSATEDRISHIRRWCIHAKKLYAWRFGVEDDDVFGKSFADDMVDCSASMGVIEEGVSLRR